MGGRVPDIFFSTKQYVSQTRQIKRAAFRPLNNVEGSRTYIHTSLDLFKAQRDSKAFETCWKTLRKTSSNWCVSRSIVFEVGVVFKNVSESG